MIIETEEGKQVEIRDIRHDEVYDMKMQLIDLEDTIPTLQKILKQLYTKGDIEVFDDLENIFPIEHDILEMIENKIFKCSIEEGTNGDMIYTVQSHLMEEHIAYLQVPNYKDIQLFQKLMRNDIINDNDTNYLNYVDIIVAQKLSGDSDLIFNIEKAMRLPIVLRYQYLLKKKNTIIKTGYLDGKS